MKKVLTYSLLAIVFLLNTGAGCSSSTPDDPKPDSFDSLLGKWELIRVGKSRSCVIMSACKR
jgi:hypothetical protein